MGCSPEIDDPVPDSTGEEESVSNKLKMAGGSGMASEVLEEGRETGTDRHTHTYTHARTYAHTHTDTSAHAYGGAWGGQGGRARVGQGGSFAPL